MVGEAERGAYKPPDDIDIGRLRRERKGERRKCGLSIEAGAPHARPGQKVCDWFQGKKSIVLG